MNYKTNEGKKLMIEVEGVRYERMPIKTHVITDQDTLSGVLSAYAKPLLEKGDIVFISEKAVACTQKRAIPMKDIHPRRLARFLCKFVYKNPYGIGLSIPETMEMALRECGVVRILFAAFISLIGKAIGRRGWFYNIAGEKARSIDGPCDCTIPPYNEYVVLGPLDPDETAAKAAQDSGCPLVCIVDINDLGGNILGISKPEMDRGALVKILKDNPLGQSDEQTPLGIIRKAAAKPDEFSSVRAWFAENRERIIADLKRIVSIPSVSEPGGDPAPFGQGCRDVLDEMLLICKEHGVDAQNHEYYCGSAVLPGMSDTEIGFWSHLDIVPEGGGWQYPPFGGETADGFLIGRGAQDNKCAAVGGLYVMLCLRDLKIPLKSGVRVFFGCDEESGMADQAYYRERFKLPDYSIVADSQFPVCYGEKGILEADLVSPALSGDILGISGGLAGNMVAGKAEIRLKKTEELISKIDGLASVQILEDSVIITAQGKSSHAAHPEGSRNAIGVLADLLLERGLIPQPDQRAFAFISAVCGDYSGKPLGIAAGHEEFGDLTCIGGMVSLQNQKAVLNINVRYPYSENGGAVAAAINASCEKHGFTVENSNDRPPSCVSRDSDFVKALTEAFAEVTGINAPAYIMGGGTYARNLPNAVAFGPEFPAEIAQKRNFPAGHGGVHEPDEALSLDEYLRALEIYVRSIIKLDSTLA